MGFVSARDSGYEVAYLLVTPVRDEREFLHDLVTSVRGQELRPRLWLFVDDGSRDGTSEELDAYAADSDWIHVTHMPSVKRRPPSALRYAEVLGFGFQLAAELAEAEGSAYEYVVNLDADVRCPPDLVAELVNRAERDRMLGIASASLAEVREGGEVQQQAPPPCGSPAGGLRLWRRDCLESIALSPTPHWASVTGLRARNCGWKTVGFADLQAEVVRPDAERGGWWSGYRELGAAGWHVGMHPLVVAAQAVSASANEGDLRGLALLAGYLESALLRRRRTHDPEVLSYFGDDLPRERLESWLHSVGADRLVDRISPLLRSGSAAVRRSTRRRS